MMMMITKTLIIIAIIKEVHYIILYNFIFCNYIYTIYQSFSVIFYQIGLSELRSGKLVMHLVIHCFILHENFVTSNQICYLVLRNIKIIEHR